MPHVEGDARHVVAHLGHVGPCGVSKVARIEIAALALAHFGLLPHLARGRAERLQVVVLAEDKAAVLWTKLFEVTPRTRGERQRSLPAVLSPSSADGIHGPYGEAHKNEGDVMSQDTEIAYDVVLKPLRFQPDLTECVLYGLKWTLGAMFADPFPVRDVIVAIREVVDNILTHTDWNQIPAPSLSVRYRVQKGLPQLRVSSTNIAKDIDEATRALRFIQESISDKSSPALHRQLTARLIESASIQTGGGIGLLQVASSPRCHLEVRLQGALFRARVDVDVPELKAGPEVCSRRSWS